MHRGLPLFLVLVSPVLSGSPRRAPRGSQHRRGRLAIIKTMTKALLTLVALASVGAPRISGGREVTPIPIDPRPLLERVGGIDHLGRVALDGTSPAVLLGRRPRDVLVELHAAKASRASSAADDRHRDPPRGRDRRDPAARFGHGAVGAARRRVRRPRPPSQTLRARRGPAWRLPPPAWRRSREPRPRKPGRRGHRHIHSWITSLRG